MITTRTRILSILATVAMLVSMLACFVIPASADESVTAPYAALLEDVPGATNLAAVISTATDETTLSDALAQDVDAGNITWPTWEYGNVDYPRYAYKAVYDAAGYNNTENANVWSITEPADWTAMVDASEYDATNNPTPETFAGYTFHVTGDVDFGGNEMAPLNPGADETYVYCQENATTYPFNGTIEGHGNAFVDIYVKATAPTSGKNISFGMIGKLGPNARINNFGVDSGTITATGEAKALYVSTFGDPVSKATGARLNKVWSGATITDGDATATGTVGAAGMMALGRDSTVEINGAYFFGTLDATTKKGGILIDIKNGEDVYNSLSDTASDTAMIYLNAATALGSAINNFSVGTDVFDVEPTALTNTNNNNVTSAEIGAWEINKANAVAAAADGVDKVFFTITGKDAEGKNILRPTGDETNRIVKVNVAGLDNSLYVNLNTTELTKAYLAELTENANIIGYKLDEGDEVAFTDTNYVELTGDEQTITFTMTEAGALDAAKEKYTNLLAYSQYLTEGAVNAINTFLNDEELTAGNLTEKEGTLIGQLETYYTYEDVDTDGKNIPGYSLVEELGEYNVHTAEGVAGKQVWAISAPEDWTAMVDASAYDATTSTTPETFENHIFHVTDNIDFGDVASESNPMYPLNLDNGKYSDSAGAFKGTVLGHDHAFSNIYVTDTTTSNQTGNRFIGLFGKLGGNAVIENFGVDSGKIVMATEAGNTTASTFGQAVPPATGETPARLTNVWSGAEIIVSAGSAKYAGGILTYSGTTKGEPVVNGAYFFGKLTADNTYGILYQLRTGTVTNALSDPETATYALHLNSNATASMFKNIYSVGTDPVNVGSSSVELTATHGGNAASALAGAWAINNAQTTEDEIADVYFTLDGENIRFGNADNRIVKVSVNEGEKEIYLNNGETLDKAYFADLYEVSADAIIVGEVTGGTYENDVLTANGDTTVAITVDYDALLESIRAEYRKLDAMYLTDAAADALNTFLTSTEDAQTVLATEGELKTALTGGVYTTYPVAQDGKAVPGYKDVELYGAYNTANVWTINEPQDWIDMVRDSATSNFDNHVFHVTTDINFEDQPMLPLSFGDNGKVDDAAYRFNGTINGYGNAFKNINVLVEDLDTSATNSHIAVGMIGKLGNKARINNFGVDSGSITVDGTIYSSRTLYVSTFGEALHYEAGTSMVNSYVNDHAELNNVWSGATITAGATTGSNMAAGLLAHSLYSSVSINGGYFFGTLSPAEGSFGITTHARQTTVNNVLSDSATAAAMFTSHAGVTAANNVYATGSTTIDATTFAITNYGNVSSALEGAWTINSKQSAEDANAVYFTLKENGDIRFGEEANRIVKVTVNDEPEYVNVGTTLDKAYFVDLFGVSEAAITAIKVGDSDEPVDSVAAADDLVVTVELDVNGTYQKQLTDKLAEYDLENLNLDYFKTADELEAGKIGLKAFVEMARTAIETQTGLAEAVAQIGNVVAEIKGASDYENLPAFKDHALYEEYQPANANWLIVDKDDWKEMHNVAKAAESDERYVDATGKYFEGITFHLKDNVQFEYDKAILPLGLRDGRVFSGTIDGHGHGFENIYIEVSKTTLVAEYGESYTSVYSVKSAFGLIGFLGGCEIRNFGINSGWIQAGTGNAQQSATTFGCVAPDATSAEDKLILTNVWNNGWLVSSADAGVSGLFGTYSRHNEYAIYADVDGAVIDGTLIQSSTNAYPLVAGLVGGFATKLSVEGMTFSNVIVSADMGFGTFTKGATPAENSCEFGTTCANGTTIEAKHVTMLALNDTAAYNASQFTNVYGIQGGKGDNEKVLSGAVIANTQYKNDQDSVVISGFDALLNTKTEFEAAYEMNTTANDGVYFTLAKDGGIRPTDSATNKIVKVEATVGEETKTAYINANQAYTNAELRDALGYGVETTITNVEVTSGGEYVEGVLTVTGDAVITVTIDVCEHTDVEYAHDGKNSHTATCAGCGYVFETEACEKNWVAGVVNADGTSVHKATCPDCKHEYEEACPGGTKEQNVDCTEDDTWVFTCGVHADRVVAEGTAETGHDFENGEGWKQDEVDENKQYRQCGHEGCEVKEYRLLGVASASGVELYCKENGTITITLPENLASADLTFAIEGEGYTITHVNGTEWNGGVYAVTAGGDVTVTIAADVTAVGGTFNVEVANAKDAEGTAIEFAGATATIGFTSIEGDANGDKIVNLADALAALYKVAQKPGAADINEKNADIDGTEGFTINDVYAIVREWLRTTLGE